MVGHAGVEDGNCGAGTAGTLRPGVGRPNEWSAVRQIRLLGDVLLDGYDLAAVDQALQISAIDLDHD